MGIINMNGRIYDPLIGRFMSADPYIQAPDDLQSHNRYAYVMNNPLNLTDPSGFSWLSKTWKKAWKSPIFKAVLGIVVAIYAPALLNYFFGAATTTLGMAANAIGSGMLSGFASTGTLKGAMLGGLTAGIMFGAGEIAGALKLADGSIGKMALHAGAGCLSSVAGGGDCKSGAISGALGEFGHNIGTGNSMELGAIKSAMLGGIGSKLAGGKFADGAVTGAFGYMFNYCAHNGCFEKRFNWNDAVDQWKNGKGTTVTDVHVSELNLSGASYQKNADGTYQIHTSVNAGDTWPIYGTVTGVINPDNTMSLKPDTYNFDIKKNTDVTSKDFLRVGLRNWATAAGLVVNGLGTPFKIVFTGSIPIPRDLSR